MSEEKLEDKLSEMDTVRSKSFGLSCEFGIKYKTLSFFLSCSECQFVEASLYKPVCFCGYSTSPFVYDFLFIHIKFYNLIYLLCKNIMSVYPSDVHVYFRIERSEEAC